MNILYRIKRKANSIVDDFYFKRQGNHLKREIENNHSKAIYLFSTPTHSNLGDQAQLYCWHLYFSEHYPQYRVFDIPALYRDKALFTTIREHLKEQDLLFIHSGYLIYDPHPELPFIMDVVNSFHQKPITILPQTINLQNDEIKKKVTLCFNDHPNLTLMCRDEVSYGKAQMLFPKCTLRLYPDIVTSLIGRGRIADSSVRDGVLFCLRNDGEKFYKPKDLKDFQSRFEHVDVFDTTINVNKRKWCVKREQLIIEVIKKFSHYKLVVTDRYHGTIFSAVANTPVIVISSVDHKLESGVKWFSDDVFKDAVLFADNLEKAESLAKRILKGNQPLRNPNYFLTRYYSVPFA